MEIRGGKLNLVHTTCDAGLSRRGRVIRQDIAALRSRVFSLLDLCGLKDGQVPSFHLDPTPVRYSNPHFKVISGAMSSFQTGASKQTRTTATVASAANTTSLSQSTPHRPIRGRGSARVAGRGRHQDRRHRDTASYADMLIEQLLAAHANSPLTDSDTSPPSAEDASATQALAVIDASQTPVAKESNNNNKDRIDPMQLQFTSPCELQTASTLVEEPHFSHESCLTHIESSSNSKTAANSLAPVNTVCGSTPELPTSDSSDSLDIPFASLFDKINCQDFEATNIVQNTSGFDLSMNPSSPDLPRATYYNFPVQYSHSYARELEKIESVPQQSSVSQTSNPQHLSPARPIPPEPCTPTHCSEAAANAGGFHETPLFTFSEPLVVSLPPLAHSRKFDKSDHNIDKNYKPHLPNKTAHFDVEDSNKSSPIRPPVPPRRPMTDSKVGSFFVRSGEAEVGALWIYSAGRSTSDETIQRSEQQIVRASEVPPSVEHRLPVNNSSCSFHGLDIMSSVDKDQEYWLQETEDSRDCYVTARPKEELQNILGHGSDSASKRRKVNDKVIHPITNSNTEGTAPYRSVRQRLFLTPSSTSAQPSENLSSPNMRIRRKKRQSPAMRRLSQQKENNVLSSAQNVSSPRRPLTDVYNIRLNESEALTTSSNSLTHSSEAHVKSSETSPDLPLISREEELLDRDAYYCDFTVDRQNKIDALSAKKVQPFRTVLSTAEKKYVLRDPTTKEILVRSVEGAESSPKTFAFLPPPSTVKSYKSVALTPSNSRHSTTQSFDSNTCTPQPQARRPFSVKKKSSENSNQESRNSYSSSQQSPALSHRSSRSSSRHTSPTRTRSSSSRSSARKKCTTHPMASSTFIMEAESTSPEAESESIYTWSIDEDASSCNLEKSYIRSTSSKKKRKFRNNHITPRPPTSVGRDSPKNGFNITAMVNRLHNTFNWQRGLQPNRGNAASNMDLTAEAFQVRQAGLGEISGRNIVAAAPSFIQSMEYSKITNSQYSEALSTISSNQATTSSIFFNRAKASIQCSSNEPSQVSNFRLLSFDSATNIRQISASEPVLHSRGPEDDASHSLVPSDTDTTPETSDLEERLAIPGKSSSSGSSTYTAARCRPREWKRSPANALPQTHSELSLRTEAASTYPADEAESGSPKNLPEGEAVGQASAQQNQDLLDSILTDSPKSVDSSGIFAPYNSYNSPVESVGSHNGYSSTVSSSVTSSDTNYNYNIYKSRAAGYTAPPPTPPSTRNNHKEETEETTLDVELAVNTSSTFIGKAPPLANKSENEVEFKKPFAPAPHVNHTLVRPHTRNQGVTAEAASASASSSTSATPRRPMSVRSDPLANQSVFAVPPGVLTGPPKIKDKKSLVRKLKKFSSHFYKKEKIQTLANL
ncbi:hypothetical protein ElyMa_004904000 [Elysia marginata]|uniref:Uncharacterized protein n=1 Tax=Elysia marginata TaxID=1093978 RepID=A0AAV4IYP0_9GAST|nr:hypothetical protein ElyMa_004904000 [Elysia marginata]